MLGELWLTFSHSTWFFAASSQIVLCLRCRCFAWLLLLLRPSYFLFGRLPISLLVLSFFWALNDVIIPGFHSAALLANLSSLCEAIFMACRHFNFLCFSIQFPTLNVRIFSSASLVLLLAYSIQSSSSSWLESLSLSLSKGRPLSWS